MGVASFTGVLAVSCPFLASKVNWKIALGPVWGTKTKRFDGAGTIACAFSAVARL